MYSLQVLLSSLPQYRCLFPQSPLIALKYPVFLLLPFWFQLLRPVNVLLAFPVPVPVLLPHLYAGVNSLLLFAPVQKLFQFVILRCL